MRVQAACCLDCSTASLSVNKVPVGACRCYFSVDGWNLIQYGAVEVAQKRGNPAIARIIDLRGLQL